MTKQLQATMAAMMVLSTISVRAQLSTTTTTTKPNADTTKTTVVTTDKSGSKSKARSRSAKSSATRTPAGHHSRNATPRVSSTARELQELRQQMLDQQAEIDTLKQASADKDARLAQANADSAAVANAALANQQNAITQQQELQTLLQATSSSVQTLSIDVSDLKIANTGLAQTLSDTKRDLNDKIDSPTTLHYKGVTITPVAFFALESVWRQRSINSDLATPFNSTPYPGANEAHVSEFNFSGRQSRLGALIEGNTGPFKLQGYFETDFLSSGTTSNDNQSNSYTLRQRQIWGRVETATGFAVTGGQMWSLVTENTRGTDNRTEKLPNTIDPNYHVGYSWARQPALRIQQKIGNPFLGAATTIAVSLEQGQTQFAGANAPNNFIFGGSGSGGGLYNSTATYANNVAPDVVAKIAFDGKHAHGEIGGVARFFRDEYYPIVQNAAGVVSYSTNLQKDTKAAGGAFGNVRFLSKYVDVAAQGMWGDGTGRYGASQLGDVVAHPDGTLEPIRNSHGLFGVETHPTKRLDLYAYYGAEYNQRTVYASPYTGLSVGYGPASLPTSGCTVAVAPTVGNTGTGVGGVPTVANCSAPTRLIEEGTFGYTYRLVNSPKYGRLQYQFLYSYLERTSWPGLFSGTYGSPTSTYRAGHAENNMIFGGMRYYIP